MAKFTESSEPTKSIAFSAPPPVYSIISCMASGLVELKTADAPFSLTGEEFKVLVSSARIVKEAIGSAHIAFGKTKKENQSKKWRRSIFVVKDIKKGEKFVKGVNVRSIRPADGLHTRHWDLVLGSTATKDIEEGTPLSFNLLDTDADIDI